MTPETVIEIGQAAMKTVFFVAGPMLVAGMVVGLLISIVQAATQINEMTMTFVPKIIAVFLVLVLSLPWAIGNLTSFTTEMFNHDKALKAKYKIPPDHKVGLGLVLGYPAVKFSGGVRRRLGSVRFA